MWVSADPAGGGDTILHPQPTEYFDVGVIGETIHKMGMELE